MKRFKLKNKKYNLVILLILGLSLIFTSASNLYLKKLSKTSESNVNVKILKKGIKKSNKIKDYVNNTSNLIEEVDIKKYVTDVISKENDKYVSVIFDYETGKEVTFDSLIKDSEKNNFWNKISYLLHLKYPTFIADILATNAGENVYYLKNNELIIYFYNYSINPTPTEELLLHVNFSEIKDYLNIEVDLDSAYQNEDGSKIDLNKKIIAITFDDGPCNHTSGLIDTLVANKATATFFMLGKNLNRYADTVKKADENKMEVAYHSYNHENFKRQEIAKIVEEYNTSNAILKNITGKEFSLIRPPYGAINAEVKEALNNPFILWSVDTLDWRYKDPEYLKNYVLENAKDGDIVLFHDIHKTSIETIEALLPLLYINGYQVVTVSTLAKTFGASLSGHNSYRSFSR